MKCKHLWKQFWNSNAMGRAYPGGGSERDYLFYCVYCLKKKGVRGDEE